MLIIITIIYRDAVGLCISMITDDGFTALLSMCVMLALVAITIMMMTLIMYRVIHC